MNIRTKVCPVCGKCFSYEIGKGKDRKHCSDECRMKHKKHLSEKRMNEYPMCKTNGCNNKANRVKYGLCESCYYRLRRTGTTNKNKPIGRYKTGAGYIKILDPEHPLSDSRGQVFEHRKVIYDSLGDGPHDCYWCGVVLDWDSIVIDHLNENKQDNDISNLVISCNDCNRARGAMLPFIKRIREQSFDTFIKRIVEYHNN